MDEQIRKMIGSPDGLQFSFDFFEDAEHSTGEGWAHGIVLLEGAPIWHGSDDQEEPAPLRWSWLDLLEFLAENWPWLLYEESYPLPLRSLPLHPGERELWSHLERRWEGQSEELMLLEDEVMVLFEHRHDLAKGMKGLFVPSIKVLRQGNEAWVVTPEEALVRPFDEVITTLEEAGEAIAEHVRRNPTPRAQAALSLWDDRRRRAQDLRGELATGLGPERLRRLVDGAAVKEYLEIPEDPRQESALLAAARMSRDAVASVEEQRFWLEQLRDIPVRQTPKLDALAEDAASVVDDQDTWYDQGYDLALWLRSRLGVDLEAPVNPEGLLGEWGVYILTFERPDSRIEAMACWGPRHGPAVVMNTTRNLHPGHSYGRRTTLAHEICHLIIDRERSLPAVEVMGGATPVGLEKRAKAFAAEFLLPRETAADRVRRSDSLERTVRSLSSRYKVSQHVAALQIKNSSASPSLTAEEHYMLHRVIT